MAHRQIIHCCVLHGGERLDRWLCALLGPAPRALVQGWVRDGAVRVGGKVAKASLKLRHGDEIHCEATFEQTRVEDAPEAMALDIRFEDEDVIVLCKPAGLVVHPAAGNPAGTLLNGLLHRYAELANLPRAGIVHRLDKDTSGLMVVARSARAHASLVAQLAERSVRREYDALVNGYLVAGGTVDAPLGRHRVDRLRQAIREDGRPAVTHYRVEERFRRHSWLRVRLETGRTHQIRVHMASRRHVLIGDRLYGYRVMSPPGAAPELQSLLQQFPRQALHARELAFNHPATGERLSWNSPMPDDMQSLLQALRTDSEQETS